MAHDTILRITAADPARTGRVPPLPFPVFPGLSAATSLSLSADGPIEPRLWDLAHAHDQSHPLPRPRLRLGRVTLKADRIVQIMVAIILDELARKGLVLREDFQRHGLKPIEYDRHFEDAMRRAAILCPGLVTGEEHAA